MAFKRSFSLHDLKNKNYKKVAEKSVSTTIVGGQLFSSGSQTRQKSIKTGAALERLGKNSSTTSLNPGASELDLAVDMLETIGCCVVDMSSSFSLISTQTDTEAVENPNISGSVGGMKNKNTTATDKFSNPADPFYELDGAPPRRTQLETMSIKSNKFESQTVTLSADLAAMNLSDSGSTLKYFK